MSGQNANAACDRKLGAAPRKLGLVLVAIENTIARDEVATGKGRRSASALQPFHGAIECLKKLDNTWHIVLCGNAITKDLTRWVANHFGQEWMQRLILTSDKTLLRADVLIDGQPKVEGIARPVWHKVTFAPPPPTTAKTPPQDMNTLTAWDLNTCLNLLCGPAKPAANTSPPFPDRTLRI